mgnify:CR=1 FL=1
MEWNFEGLGVGLAAFLVIGLFHPVVVKTEYHFGTRPWWVFLVFGLICCGVALYVKSSFWSAILGVVAFSSFWTIKELFEQKERVRKGWFPKKPDKRETQ